MEWSANINIKGEKAPDFVQQAEQAAGIVSKGLEEGDYSTILKQLDEISIENGDQEQYVYNHESIILYVLRIILYIVLTLGFAYVLVIGIGTLAYSEYYFVYGVICTVLPIIIIFINVILILKSVSHVRFYQRYDKYKNILRHHTIELTDDLVEYTNRPINQIVKDLKNAIQFKLIPQGHFGKGNVIFILSDEMYNIYQEKQALFDRYYRKQLEERNRMSGRTKEIKQIIDSGQRYVEKIHECNDIIKDKEITKKLDRMEEVVKSIFDEVDLNPDQADKLGLFLNYYMPTTEKLLEAYIDIDEKKISGENLEKSKMEIEKVLDTINSAFEGILNRFYQEQEIDIVSDISAMETMMKQEKLV